MFDHATGIVIGETAEVGDYSIIFHNVTLGGTGTDLHADRHPKLGKAVLVGAGSTLLGNIKIGDGVKIGAGSVVTCDIEAGQTAIGVPAQIISKTKIIKNNQYPKL